MLRFGVRRPLAVLLTLAAVSLARGNAMAQTSTPTAAAPADDEAAKAKARGDSLMLAGQPAEALSAYAESYALRKDPALLFNRGRAYEALGDYPAALEQLEAFEKDATPELRARVPGLPKLLGDIRRRVSTVTILCDVDGAQVRVRDRSVGTTPLTTLRLAAGAAVLEISKEGFFSQTRTLDLPGGGLAQVDVKLVSKTTSALVTITSPVKAARIRLNGEVRGATPLDVVLPAGSYRLDADKAGFEPVQTNVVVGAGDRKTVDVPMDRSFSLASQWWFWTALGVVVVGAGVGTYVALTTEKDAGSGTLGSPGRIQLPSWTF